MRRVLFLSERNTGRSLMAEAYVRLLGGDDFQVESAGFTPGMVSPLVAEIMAEVGVDLAGHRARDAMELYRDGLVYDYVVTLCSESPGGCPLFTGVTHRLRLPLPDPAQAMGNHEEQLAQVRAIREAIKQKMAEFVAWVRCGGVRKLGEDWELIPG